MPSAGRPGDCAAVMRVRCSGWPSRSQSTCVSCSNGSTLLIDLLCCDEQAGMDYLLERRYQRADTSCILSSCVIAPGKNAGICYTWPTRHPIDCHSVVTAWQGATNVVTKKCDVMGSAAAALPQQAEEQLQQQRCWVTCGPQPLDKLLLHAEQGSTRPRHMPGTC